MQGPGQSSWGGYPPTQPQVYYPPQGYPQGYSQQGYPQLGGYPPPTTTTVYYPEDQKDESEYEDMESSRYPASFCPIYAQDGTRFSWEARSFLERARGLSSHILSPKPTPEQTEDSSPTLRGRPRRKVREDFDAEEEEIHYSRRHRAPEVVVHKTYIVHSTPYWYGWGGPFWWGAPMPRDSRSKKDNNFLIGLVFSAVGIVSTIFVGKYYKEYTEHKERLNTVFQEDSKLLKAWKDNAVRYQRQDVTTNPHYQQMVKIFRSCQNLMEAKANNAWWNLALSVGIAASAVFTALGAFYGVDPMISGGGAAFLFTACAIGLKYGYRHIGENYEHKIAREIQEACDSLGYIPQKVEKEEEIEKPFAPFVLNQYGAWVPQKA